jgi:hypothetical protein
MRLDRFCSDDGKSAPSPAYSLEITGFSDIEPPWQQHDRGYGRKADDLGA